MGLFSKSRIKACAACGNPLYPSMKEWKRRASPQALYFGPPKFSIGTCQNCEKTFCESCLNDARNEIGLLCCPLCGGTDVKPECADPD